MVELFDVGRPAIAKHLNNIFNENELDKSSVCSKMEHTEFEKYRVKQEKLYKSDFDLLLEETQKMG